MILKFTRSKDYIPKHEYFNVPDNSILHKTRTHDDGLEDWVIVVDSEYYESHYFSIYGKITRDLHIQSVTLEEYTFIFIYSVTPYGWMGISKIEFDNIFQPFFDSIYIYECMFKEREAVELCKPFYESSKDVDYSALTKAIKDCSIISRAIKIKYCNNGGFEVIDISWTDNFGKDTGINMRTQRVMPCDLLNTYGYKSTLSVTKDPYDFDMLMQDCYYELGFNEWRCRNENI